MYAFVEAPDGERERLAAKVAALRRPDRYPGNVRSVEAIETHMSWVFLTELHAYKLKKPIRTLVLDHTSLEARRRACHNEVSLNRRLAPNVYLGVVAVMEVGGGLAVEAVGEPVEWLVKMRRLPRHLMLDACIERQVVEMPEADRIAETMSEFYAAADPNPLAGSAYRERLVSDIESKTQSLGQPRYGLCRDDIDGVRAAHRRWLAEHDALLQERGAFVVDGHGDLRPEHICLEPQPVIIDCLEFSRELRLLDPISELSFLALECRRLGAPWIGERVLAGHARHVHSSNIESLVSFYQSYHAVVRAAVAIWHLDDDALGRTGQWQGRATWYLQAAKQILQGR